MISANSATKNGLISQIYEWLILFCIKTANSLVKNWAEDLNRLTFLQRLLSPKKIYNRPTGT